MYVAQTWKRVTLVTIAAAAAVLSWPHGVAARGHGGDPIQQADRQRHRSDVTRMKHRKDADLRGAEIRDAKKSAKDSKESQMQTELGPVNEQTDRWSLYY